MQDYLVSYNSMAKEVSKRVSKSSNYRDNIFKVACEFVKAYPRDGRKVKEVMSGIGKALSSYRKLQADRKQIEAGQMELPGVRS